MLGALACGLIPRCGKAPAPWRPNLHTHTQGDLCLELLYIQVGHTYAVVLYNDIPLVTVDDKVARALLDLQVHTMRSESHTLWRSKSHQKQACDQNRTLAGAIKITPKASVRAESHTCWCDQNCTKSVKPMSTCVPNDGEDSRQSHETP